MDDLFDEVGMAAKKGPACPKCHAELKPNAIMCVACGFEFQTGEHREGVKIQQRGHGGHGEAADSLLSRAARQIEIDKVEDRKNISQGSPAYVYLFGLAVIIAFATMMFTLPKGLAFYITGIALLVFVGVIQQYYNIRFIIAAFYEGVGYGFLQFVPFYSIYYLITRWDRVGKWFMKGLAMIPLALLGGALMALGYWLGFKYPDKTNSWQRHEPRSQVTCIAQRDSECVSRL
jgi:hypothetical protein